jgi:hypothetical protein
MWPASCTTYPGNSLSIAKSGKSDDIPSKLFSFFTHFQNQRISMPIYRSEECFVSEDVMSYGIDLFEELQPLLITHDKGPDELANALKEAHQSMLVNYLNDRRQDQRAVLLQLTLWHLFGKKESLWIHTTTKAGNEVPTKVLVEAYFVWESAVKIARKCGVDAAVAAEVMAIAVHATADQKAKDRANPNGIRDIRKYIFASFMHAIHLLASNQGMFLTYQWDFAYFSRAHAFSDRGAFADFMDRKIMYKEFWDSLDPDPKHIAHARFVLECSWVETAEFTQIPKKIAQKTLSKVRIPVDVDRPFHLKLSTRSIRCCPPIPVEVVQ